MVKGGAKMCVYTNAGGGVVFAAAAAAAAEGRDCVARTEISTGSVSGVPPYTSPRLRRLPTSFHTVARYLSSRTASRLNSVRLAEHL